MIVFLLFVLTEWLFALPPVVRIIQPLNGEIISCERIQVRVSIHDSEPINRSSLFLTAFVGTEVYEIPDSLVSIFDTLYIFPFPRNLTGNERVELLLAPVSDILGNESAPVHWGFFVDRVPPVVHDIVPLPGQILDSPLFAIQFGITDSLAGVDTDSSYITVNGRSFPLSASVVERFGEAFIFYPQSAGLNFIDGETVSVCINAFDMARICGKNERDTCFSYFVETEGPIVWSIFPHNGSSISCDDTMLILGLTDRNGVDPSTIVVLFDGDTIVYGDPRLYYMNGKLTFSLYGIYEGFHSFSLLGVRDSLGNAMSSVFDVNFIFDRTPPVLADFSPCDGCTVSTLFPVFSLGVYDSGVGVALQPLLVMVEVRGQQRYFTLSDSLTIAFSNGQLVFDFENSGIALKGGDTIRVCVIAYDSIDYCSPNMNDTCIVFFVEHSPPIIELISPPFGSYSSCEFESIRFRLIDDDGIDPTSIRLVVNGTEFRWGMQELFLSNDTLVFSPRIPFSNGVYVYYTLFGVNDLLQNAQSEPFNGYFYVDLSPPYVRQFYPPQGYVSPDTFQRISIFFEDNLSGIDPSSIVINVNGAFYDISDSAIEYENGVITYSPRIQGNHFEMIDTVNVEVISIADMAQHCGANWAHNLLSFSFFIDGRLPVVYPSGGVISSCARQIAWIYLFSPLGIIEDSILFEVDGEVYTISDTEIFLRNDTLYFVPAIDYGICDTVHLRLLRATDGFHSFDTLSWEFLVDRFPPEIEILYPQCGETLSMLNPTILIRIFDGCAGVDLSSISVDLSGNIISSDDPRIFVFGDTILFHLLDILPFVRGGDEIRFRVVASDSVSPLYCGPNVSEKICTFWIESGGPEVRIVEPAIFYPFISCENISFKFYIHDENGISELWFFVNGERIIDGNPGYSFRGDTLVYSVYGLADGERLSFLLYAADSLYNVSETLEVSYIVDLAPPEISFISPPPRTIVNDSVVEIFAIVDDYLSGVDSLSLGVRVNGVDYPFEFRSDTLVFSVPYFDHEYETLAVEIFASDRTAGCASNLTIYRTYFIRDLEPPRVTLVLPGDNEFVSCENQAIVYRIDDYSGIEPASIMLEVNGSIYTMDSGSLRFRDDTLLYLPRFIWENAETVEFSIRHISDNAGNMWEESEYHRFVVDLMPPSVFEMFPAPNETLRTRLNTIRFLVFDSISGVDISSLRIGINGDYFTLHDSTRGIVFTEDTVLINLEELRLHFHGGDSVRVCVEISDRSSRCGANFIDSCFIFYIYETRILLELIEPAPETYSSCLKQPIKIRFLSSLPLDVDSLLFVFNNDTFYISDEELQIVGDTIIFIPPYDLENGVMYNFSILKVIDIVGNPTDSTLESFFVVDREPPEMQLISPLSGSRIGSTTPTILWEVTDNLSGARFDSLFVGGRWVRESDGVYFDGEFVRYALSEPIGVGTFNICLAASDNASYCGNNSGIVCDSFTIDTIPPQIHILEPENGVILGCRELRVLAVCTDADGIDTNSTVLMLGSVAANSLSCSIFGDTLEITTIANIPLGVEINCTLFVADTLGNLGYGTFWFIYDTLKPEFLSYFPRNGTVYRCPSICASIVDFPAGIDLYGLQFTVNESSISVCDSGLSWDGLNLCYFPRYDFEELDTVRVHIEVCDNAQVCPPNCGTLDWTFFILDDDTVPPLLIRFDPASIYYEMPTKLNIFLYDESGIYVDSLSPFVELRNPSGEIIDTMVLTLISVNGDTSAFQSESELVFTNNYRFVEFRVHCYDNDMDNFRLSDRSQYISDWKTINLLNYSLMPGSMTIELGEFCFRDTLFATITLKNPSQYRISIDSIGINFPQMLYIQTSPDIPFTAMYLDTISLKLRFKFEQLGNLVFHVAVFSKLFSYPIAQLTFACEVKDCLPSRLSVAPNPFSPNGDLINDEVIFEFPWYDRTEIVIFNLRGEPIRWLYSNNGMSSWDGKDENGRVQDAGIYPYIIKVENNIRAKGSVILAR